MTSVSTAGFKHLETLHTKYCADTVEWCPITEYTHFFVCGTYELQKSEKNAGAGGASATETSSSTTAAVRVGQLHLFSVVAIPVNPKLRLHDTLSTSAILDIKWCTVVVCGKIVLASCNADGKVVLWQFKYVTEKSSSVERISEFRISNGSSNPDVLSLSLDWSVHQHNIKLCVSDSLGNVSILYLDKECQFALSEKIKISDYETWITTFDLANDCLIYAGSDDSFIKTIDLRCSPQIVGRIKEHEHGVTSLRCNHLRENVLSSGSYDETVRIWDMRNTRKSLSSCHVGGGIWRIKWDIFTATNMLIAGMYSGAFLLHYANIGDGLHDMPNLKLTAEYKQHENIVYGADFSRLLLHEDKSSLLAVTCSFYDKRLCLSEVSIL